MATPKSPAASAPDPLPANLAVEIEPFTDDELDTAIDAIWANTPDDIPAAVGTFLLSDEGRAEWAMRKLRGFSLRLVEVNRQHDDWVARIEGNREALTVRLDARVTVFRTALERYGVLRRKANKDDATIRLPSGVVKTTESKRPVVSFSDETRFATWARRHLPPEQLANVVKDIPKLYIMELRKLHLRVVDEGVQWSADGKTDWVLIDGVTSEPAGIVKPSVTPDLTR